MPHADDLTQFHPQLRGYIGRAQRNLERVDGLLFHDHSLEEPATNPRLDPTDILRAAVVLLHATLEDLLRSISLRLMPLLGPDVWDSISATGTQQPEKVKLGWLLQFRGMSVSDLLAEKARVHFTRVSYSSTNEISGQLQRLGLTPRDFEEYYPSLDQLITRRHRIVHWADIEETAHTQTGLNWDDVRVWQNHVHDFLFVLAQKATEQLNSGALTRLE